MCPRYIKPRKKQRDDSSPNVLASVTQYYPTYYGSHSSHHQTFGYVPRIDYHKVVRAESIRHCTYHTQPIGATE